MILSSIHTEHSKRTTLTVKDLIAVVCFFTSGFVGLVYEICWIRKASLVFGTTTFAVSTVVAIFFAGLALGSYIFGRYSQKTFCPLMLYALLEISLGVFALLNPFMFTWADNLYGLFYPAIMHNFFLLSFIRFILTVFLILPPTILMGGTLPLFCRQYVVSEKKILLSVGLLYALNTLGAAFGCAACGLFLIPNIGVNKTIWLGAVLNIIIGIIVGKMRITAAFSHQANTESEVHCGKDSLSPISSCTPAHSTARSVFIIPALFFLSGFAALGNEILWVRYLSLIIRNTVYTYTLTLMVILTGIVLGSILISAFADRTYRRGFVFGTVHILSGICVLALLMLPARWWRGVINTTDFSEYLWIFISLLLLPAVLSGISFPLAIRMVVKRPTLAGIGVGRMTAINTVGGIAGSLAIGFIALPSLGLQKALLLTTGISLIVGFTALLLLEHTLRPLVRKAIVILSLLVWLAIPFGTGTQLPADFLVKQDEQLVDFREGLNSNLAVIKKKESGVLKLTIDRMWQGEDRKNHQVMAAHIPALLHKNPKDVLVVGLGVGQTAGRFLLYDIERLDCVDIENGLFEFVQKHFDSGWVDDKRLRIIVEDGRNYLSYANNKYDIISIEVGQVFRPGLANFYTIDFYQRARQRLNVDGIICQFVPILSLGLDELHSVIRSFLEVFPESVLWYNTSEFLLIGSASGRLKFSSDRLTMLSSVDVIREDLRFSYWGGPAHWLNQWEVFLAGFLCGPQTLAKITADASIYRDDLPQLEYQTARRQGISGKPFVDLIWPDTDSFALILDEKLKDQTVSKMQSIREMNLHDVVAASLQPAGFHYTANEYVSQDDILQLLEAIQWNPYNVTINLQLGVALARRGQTQKAISYYNAALRIDPENYTAHYSLGTALARQGKLEEAIIHFTESLRIKPDYADAHSNLGYVLDIMGRLDEAIKHYSEALRIEPDFARAHYNLGTAYARQGKLEEAIEHFKGALRINPDFTGARESLEEALLQQGKTDEPVQTETNSASKHRH